MPMTASFTCLFLLDVGIACVALYRLRPATFIIAANLALVTHAFQTIAQFGQPRSQSFVPPFLFTSANLATAFYLLSLVTLLALPAALVRSRQAPTDVRRYPSVPRWLLVLFVAYAVAVAASSGSLLQRAYAVDAWTVGGVNLAGANLLLNSIVLYEVVRRAWQRQIKPAAALGILLALYFATDFSKGATGLASGFLITAAILLAGPGQRRALRFAAVLSAIGGVFALSYSVRTIRASLYSDPAGAIEELLQDVAGDTEGFGIREEGSLAGNNGSQYACHMLECISLYRDGRTREWRSAYNPLIYTFEPSFLLGLLDIKRPIDAPEELLEYFPHGGGIFVIGDLYWSGGYLCVLLLGGLVIWFGFLCDTRYRKGAPWLFMTCSFVPNLLMGMGYGFNQIFRGAANGLVGLGAYWAWKAIWQRPIVAGSLPAGSVGR